MNTEYESEYAIQMDWEARNRCRAGNHRDEEIEGLVDAHGRITAFRITCADCGEVLRTLTEDEV